jgi:NitT/TauT family transport system ATP-binding protein
MAHVNIRSVSKMYPASHPREPGVLALDDTSFDVADQEFCSILGHSGCGKTTLLNLLAGFETPTRGELSVDGTPIGNPSWRRTVVFQDYALFPWMTVVQNIGFGLRMRRVPARERDVVVRSQIALVGLAGFEHHYPHQLSGGMRQRVSIARALAVDPLVLLMDEPFAALDAQNRAAMQQEMGRLLASGDATTRKTMILVTHSIDEAILLSDRIIVLTSRPGHVKANLEVTLPRPRDESDPGYLALRQQLRELIHDEAGAASNASAASHHGG